MATGNEMRALLKLQENELLEETSAKFIRLQPDNALAKLYRALSRSCVAIPRKLLG